MNAVADTISDLDAALELLATAHDATSRRNGVRTVLACLYELREYRRGAGLARDAYAQRADSTPAGRISESLIFLRGKATHLSFKNFAPDVRGTFPGRAYPGEATPGQTYIWLRLDELDEPFVVPPRDRKFASDYTDLVADHAVVRILRTARDFLAMDPGPTS